METFLSGHGALALFGLSFLAATLVPVGSEWLLVALLVQGHDPLTAVSTATLGNTLGACTTYIIGLWGAPLVISRLLRITPAAQERAERFYGRYGSWSLLLSWVPLVGDPLCLAGGILRIGFIRFLVLVLAGKLARYGLVCAATLQAI